MALEDRFRDLVLIGEGVSAKVYRAVDPATESAVAVKVLNPHLRTDPVSLERFRREVQITRFLNHPQIVSIYDLVVDEEQIYLVMEYLPGPDLKDYVRCQHPIDIDTAVGLLTQVLRVLSVCHARNVVHRDLKPQNIMFADAGLVKLLDFGISRMTALSDLTQTGSSLGTPEYMAPELFATNTYDPRTDLYALGVIAFELLSGRLPFQGDSLAVLYAQHVRAPVPRLRDLRTEVPVWLEHLVERLLAKKGYERYQSADEVLDDINRRKVVAREVPALPKRKCVHCEAETLAELPFCTFCGRNTVEALQRGACDLLSSEAGDVERVRAYLQNVFGVSVPAPKRPTRLVLSGIERFSGEIIRQSALRHGLYLTVEEQSSGRQMRRKGSTALLVPTLGLLAVWFIKPILTLPVTLWRAFRFWTGPDAWYWLSTGGVEMMNLVWITVLVLGGWAALGAYRGEHQRPLVENPDRLAKRVSASHGWLKNLMPFFRSAAAEPLKRFVAQMVEKYLILRRHSREVPADADAKMQELLRGAADVAGVMAAAEHGLDESRLARLVSEHTTLTGELAEETEPGRRQLLSRRAEAAAQQLEAWSRLEEKHSWLTNRLVYVLYVFNTLLGRALVLRAPIDRAAVEMLDGCIGDLGADLKLSEAIRAELERVA